jgi:hypothetical protein
MRRYDSGAAKRKKVAAVHEAVSKLPKLTSYFTVPGSVSECPQHADIIVEVNPTPSDEVAHLPLVSTDIIVIENEQTAAYADLNVTEQNLNINQSIESNSNSDPTTTTSSINSPNGFDGKLCQYGYSVPANMLNEVVILGIRKLPKLFPPDKSGASFPVSGIWHTNRNGE